MSHRWMFDVLNDLETYARRNGLPDLAGSLSRASETATRELSDRPPADRGGRHLPPQPPAPPARAE